MLKEEQKIAASYQKKMDAPATMLLLPEKKRVIDLVAAMNFAICHFFPFGP